MISLHQVYALRCLLQLHGPSNVLRVHPVGDVLSCAFCVIEEPTNEVSYGNKTVLENIIDLRILGRNAGSESLSASVRCCFCMR